MSEASRLYALRNPELLRMLMQTPGRGAPYSVRGLAEAAGCARSTIGSLLTGAQKSVEMETAHNIVEAVGVALLVLFAPSASPEFNETVTGSDRGAA